MYDEVLDYRQDARVAIKARTISNYLSSQRMKRMKEWRLKCIQSASIKDELANHQHSIDVMEQRLQEYSAIINEQKNTTHLMTPSIIEKHWVKYQGKRGGHMEWTVECDKLIMELLANRCPSASVQASILVMA